MSPRPLWRGRVLALLGVVLVSLSLRTPVAAMSPIVERIAVDVVRSAGIQDEGIERTADMDVRIRTRIGDRR